MGRRAIDSISIGRQLVALGLFLSAGWLTIACAIWLDIPTLNAVLGLDAASRISLPAKLKILTLFVAATAIPAAAIGEIVLSFKRPVLLAFIIGGLLAVFMPLALTGFLFLFGYLLFWKVAFIMGAIGAYTAWAYCVFTRFIPVSSKGADRTGSH